LRGARAEPPSHCVGGPCGRGADGPVEVPARPAAGAAGADAANASGLAGSFRPRGAERLVAALPGLHLPSGHTPPTMATAYVKVSGDDEPERELFYWFVESAGDPDTDPLLLWTNGGPGCSGLSGFLTEMGPFRPEVGGRGLVPNPHAWTDFANMIFIEQPAGVGFSVIEEQDAYTYTDAKAAADMWTLVKKFVALHPQFKSRPFYLTAESYGGHYLPTTALHIVKHNQGEVNFQGFAVGNPLSYDVYNNYGQFEKWYNFGLLPRPKYDEFMARQCYKMDTAEERDVPEEYVDYCNDQTEAWFRQLFPGVEKIATRSDPGYDPYALSFDVCTREDLAKAELSWRPFGKKLAGVLAQSQYKPCAGNPINHNYGSEYLNREDVQAAIHVRGHPQWLECSDNVSNLYAVESQQASMVPVYRELVEHGGLRIMIYSGTADSICPLQGLQRWIWSQNYSIAEDWVPYVVGGQSGGFTTKLTAAGGGGIRVTTVTGAGHMVPSTKPEAAAHVLRQFLSGAWA